MTVLADVDASDARAFCDRNGDGLCFVDLSGLACKILFGDVFDDGSSGNRCGVSLNLGDDLSSDLNLGLGCDFGLSSRGGVCLGDSFDLYLGGSGCLGVGLWCSCVVVVHDQSPQEKAIRAGSYWSPFGAAKVPRVRKAWHGRQSLAAIPAKSLLCGCAESEKLPI